MIEGQFSVYHKSFCVAGNSENIWSNSHLDLYTALCVFAYKASFLDQVSLGLQGSPWQTC